jgi:hypothetical protein
MEKTQNSEDHTAVNNEYKSPYETNFFSRMLFFYMNPAMTLANKRASEGSALKGKIFSKILS